MYVFYINTSTTSSGLLDYNIIIVYRFNYFLKDDNNIDYKDTHVFK